MYKIFVLTGLVLFLTIGIAFAKTNKSLMPFVKFNGTKYTLSYSAKSTETGGFLNEYYKANQTYASWTELVGVHHYPTAYYPIEHAKEFAKYLESTGVSTNIEVDEDKNEALLYFVVMDKHKLPIVMEFDVFKYAKSPICGTVGAQFAKRYLINNPLEVEKIKKEIPKRCPKYIKKMSKFEIPEVIDVAAENGKYTVLNEGCNNHIENLE